QIELRVDRADGVQRVRIAAAAAQLAVPARKLLRQRVIPILPHFAVESLHNIYLIQDGKQRAAAGAPRPALVERMRQIDESALRVYRLHRLGSGESRRDTLLQKQADDIALARGHLLADQDIQLPRAVTQAQCSLDAIVIGHGDTRQAAPQAVRLDSVQRRVAVRREFGMQMQIVAHGSHERSSVSRAFTSEGSRKRLWPLPLFTILERRAETLPSEKILTETESCPILMSISAIGATTHKNVSWPQLHSARRALLLSPFCDFLAFHSVSTRR